MDKTTFCIVRVKIVKNCYRMPGTHRPSVSAQEAGIPEEEGSDSLGGVREAVQRR